MYNFPLGLNTLDNARENEIRLQLYQSYKQDRIYRCGDFRSYVFPHTCNVLWNIGQMGCLEKATISIIVRVMGKNDVHIELQKLAALLCSLFGPFVCFLNFSHISLTPREDKFLLSCHNNDILLKKAISRKPNVSVEFFLKQLASLVVISFRRDQNDKWTRA